MTAPESTRDTDEPVTRGVVAAALTVIWTGLGFWAWYAIRFSIGAAICDDATPHVHPAQAPWAIALALVWPAPFVIAAVRRRTMLRMIIAAQAAGVSAYLAIGEFLHPTTWCF
jgi:hypothetical protein